MRHALRRLWIAWIFCLLPSGIASASGPAGFVAAVRGEARVVRGAENIPARVGLEVVEGDLLETGERGRLKVLLSDDAVVALGGESRVELSRHVFDRQAGVRQTSLRLVGGTVRALVQQVVGKTRTSFEVKTGTAVAGVRGTEFVVEQAEGHASRLVTLSGTVNWRGADGRAVEVSAGEGSALESGVAGAPSALATAELARVRSETDAEAAPSALAWGTGPDTDDRLRPGAAAVRRAEGGDDGRDLGAEDAADQRGQVPSVIPAENYDREGGGGLYGNLLDLGSGEDNGGSWVWGADFDPGTDPPILHLTIRAHR